MKVELESGYLLTSRPYLESSLLLDVFTKDHGRISLVAKGAKRGKDAKFPLLQPFMPLLLSWQGKGSLYTLIGVELDQAPNFLQAKKLISGMYINELLVKLLAVGDPHVDLFYFYQHLIKNLATQPVVTNKYLDEQTQLQMLLRVFEKRLLIAIGYALPLSKDVVSGEGIISHKYYSFDPERGPQQIAHLDDLTDERTSYPAEPKEPYHKQDLGELAVFKGSSLLALETEVFTTKEELQDAKRLLRSALKLRLAGMTLYSRKLLYSK